MVLRQDKSVSAVVAMHGDALTYTMSDTDEGTGHAGAFSATDTLPSGVSFVGATPQVGTTTQSAGVVTWDLPGLAAGTTATLEVSVTGHGGSRRG